MIDRRFTKSRSLFPSSASSLPLPDPFSLSLSPGEGEPDDLGSGSWGMATPMAPSEKMDGGDEEGDENEAGSES